jgi:hypothetical protein
LHITRDILRITRDIFVHHSGYDGAIDRLWHVRSKTGQTCRCRRIDGRRIDGRIDGCRIDGRIDGRRIDGCRIDGRRIDGRGIDGLL